MWKYMMPKKKNGAIIRQTVSEKVVTAAAFHRLQEFLHRIRVLPFEI